ncbi:MAG TPA: NUDIX domain-containing protein [Kiritimatiellia bacterium]|nr:NUDIX domain-containing protein [Kiritimatiellia bacterium]HRZ11903.1 NUDIX domain-containing protein [Kiritimatiellia bacterium]HSA17291.1 NUDIX domain-containing protein [Kiritimatiellia bacterium]
MKEIEFIARGVLVAGGKVLVCRNRKKGNCYLPGGHIEWNESAPVALAREMKEETGLACRVGRFLGAVEHTFRHKGERVCEINLVFELRLPSRRPGAPVPSTEEKLEFFWWPIRRLDDIAVEPSPLRRCLDAWRKKPGAASWASTYGRGRRAG